MKAPETIIKPEIIQWARTRTGLTVQDFAKKMRVSENTINAWETGKAPISIVHARQLADLSLVPFGCLFLSEIPKRDLALPDFRTVNNTQVKKPSPELEATVQEMQEKQLWLREFLMENDPPEHSWIGSISVQTPVTDAVGRIRAVLGIDDDEMESCASWDAYFSLLVQKIEDAGIMVIRNGVVGNNTHRPLDIGEFRGFVLVDPIAPLIFINGQDHKNPQMFTLIHELVHVFLGQSGLVDPFGDTSNRTERYCNKVAAEFLVPGNRLRSFWKALTKEQPDIEFAIHKATRHFKVSSCVVILRCKELGLISPPQANELWEEETALFRQQRQNRSGGGDFFASLKFRVGQTFARIVISELYNQNISYGEAFRLLRVKDMQGIRKLSEKVGLPIL